MALRSPSGQSLCHAKTQAKSASLTNDWQPVGQAFFLKFDTESMAGIQSAHARDWPPCWWTIRITTEAGEPNAVYSTDGCRCEHVSGKRGTGDFQPGSITLMTR